MKQVLIVFDHLCEFRHDKVLNLLRGHRIARFQRLVLIYGSLQELNHLRLGLYNILRATPEDTHVRIGHEIVPAEVEVLKLLILTDGINEICYLYGSEAVPA